MTQLTLAMNLFAAPLFLIFVLSCANMDNKDSTLANQETEITPVEVFELKFGRQNCIPCMEEIHSNLVNQQGVIEVCSFYEKIDKDNTRKQIVARISLNGATTTIQDVINSLEKATSFTVKSFDSKLDFYE